MQDLIEYVEPSLVMLIVVLQFIGIGLKKTKLIRDNYIPLVIGAAGIVIAALYLYGTEGYSALSTYRAVSQGILCAGMSVYVNQMYKQWKQTKDPTREVKDVGVAKDTKDK